MRRALYGKAESPKLPACPPLFDFPDSPPPIFYAPHTHPSHHASPAVWLRPGVGCSGRSGPGRMSCGGGTHPTPTTSSRRRRRPPPSSRGTCRPSSRTWPGRAPRSTHHDDPSSFLNISLGFIEKTMTTHQPFGWESKGTRAPANSGGCREIFRRWCPVRFFMSALHRLRSLQKKSSLHFNPLRALSSLPFQKLRSPLLPFLNFAGAFVEPI
jgi:hypothetical protein